MTAATTRMPVSARTLTPASNGTPKLAKASAKKPPPRIIINAVEGFGKTTLGAYAPKPAILMARGETGFTTLRGEGLVPDADCVELATWQETLGVIDGLIADPAGHETVVLDALGGVERLCHEFVCKRDFSGDWGEKGFSCYQRGPDVSVAEWLLLLQRLDRLRDRGVITVILSHCKVRTFKNPMGPDYDRYTSDCHEKTWSVSHKWADAVLFGTFVTVTQDDRKTKRTKGIGGTERIFYTQRTDAYDAKSRYAMPPQFDVPNDPTAVWSTLWNAVSGGATTSNTDAPEL